MAIKPKGVTIPVIGGVHRPIPASDEPVTYLSHWLVKEVVWPKGDPTRHFIGYYGEGRVSSPVLEWHPDEHYGVTRSGRKYVLCDEAGCNSDALYVWGRWLDLNGLNNESIRDVSSEYIGKSRE